jgi:hypothetical protein
MVAGLCPMASAASVRVSANFGVGVSAWDVFCIAASYGKTRTAGTDTPMHRVSE